MGCILIIVQVRSPDQRTTKAYFVRPVDLLLERYLVVIGYPLIVVKDEVVDSRVSVMNRRYATFQDLLDLIESEIAAGCSAWTCGSD